MIEQLGWHWVFDAEGSPELLADEQRLRRVLHALPTQLGLRTVSSPQSFRHDDGGEKSVAGIILIAESHFSLHAFPDRARVHGDLFSCKPFDIGRAKTILTEAFALTGWSETVLDRGDAQKRKLRAS